MAIAEISAILAAAKTALDIGKEAKSMLPNANERNEIEKKLEATENQLKLAEANYAKNLGHDLCQCSFPPQIMLYNKNERATICPDCSHSISKKMEVEVFPTDASRWDGFI